MAHVQTPLGQIKIIFPIVIFLASFWITPVSSQPVTPQCDLHLGEYVRASDFNGAFFCAAKTLETDPSNGEAQLVLARAAQELGRPDIAAAYSRSARQQTLSRGETYASFLISGLAESHLGNRMLSKFYLRRAANIAKNPSELALIGQAMNLVRGQSPWSLSISANVDPSNNVNDGSMHDSYDTIFPDPLPISEDGQAQPGIGYSLDLNATHRYFYSDRTMIETQVYSLNTVYSGLGRNDYVLGLKSTLTYIQRADIPVRWIASIAYDQRYIGDALAGPAFDDFSHYYSQSSFFLERRWQPEDDQVWSIFGSYTARDYIGSDVTSEIYRLGGSYSFSPRQGLEIALSGYLENTDSTAINLINVAQGVAVGFNWDLVDLPYSLSGKLSYVHTQYEYPNTSDLSFLARYEDRAMLDLGVTPRRIQWFGFRPTFGVVLTRTFSNHNRYETFEASAYTKIQSVF